MFTAKLRHLRISPRKVRLVANLIRGLSVLEAEKNLRFLPKRAAGPILKLLNSAVANAQHFTDQKIAKEDLFISKIMVDAGPTLKKWMPRAMGRAATIRKRTSHLTLALEARSGLVLPKKKEPIEVAPPEDLAKEIKPTRGKFSKIVEKPEAKARPKPVTPSRPYQASPHAKDKFFSRQTFGNVKKFFRRKSI